MSSTPPFAPAFPPQVIIQSNPEYHPSPPHLEEPLVAPRPHKLTPDLPAEVPSFYTSPNSPLTLLSDGPHS